VHVTVFNKSQTHLFYIVAGCTMKTKQTNLEILKYAKKVTVSVRRTECSSYNSLLQTKHKNCCFLILVITMLVQTNQDGRQVYISNNRLKSR